LPQGSRARTGRRGAATQPGGRVGRTLAMRGKETVVLLVVLALFAALAAARLNPFCLFEPDSPEYLFGSRALAEMRGYVELDHVGAPPHTFRPPGLPLLLVPISLL